MPYLHRFALSKDKEALSRVLNVYHLALKSFYKTKEKMGFLQVEAGDITSIQRFGGALNLNVHFHTLMMDGVYYQNSHGVNTFKEIIPNDDDAESLIQRLKRRIDRVLIKSGYLQNREDFQLNETFEDSQLDFLKAQSVMGKNEVHQKPIPIGKTTETPFVEFRGKRCTYLDGFSLHANVKIIKNDRRSLENLCRYILRGVISKKRVSIASGNKVLVQLKKPYLDGTTHLSFSQEDFINRLIALIPPPRQNLIRYFGIFGARHKKRSEITSKVKLIQYKEKKPKKMTYYTPWAELLKRVFKFDVSYCDHCGNKLRWIASIYSPKVCEKIVKHIDINQECLGSNSLRAPPKVSCFEENPYEYSQESGAW